MTAGLLALFNAFAQQEASRSGGGGGGGGGGGQRQVVDPTQLREALAAFDAASFTQGVPSLAHRADTAHGMAPGLCCGPQRCVDRPASVLSLAPSQLRHLSSAGWIVWAKAGNHSRGLLSPGTREGLALRLLSASLPAGQPHRRLSAPARAPAACNASRSLLVLPLLWPPPLSRSARAPAGSMRAAPRLHACSPTRVPGIGHLSWTFRMLTFCRPSCRRPACS